jgi:uncharacterized RDD family membrane protein YckC
VVPAAGPHYGPPPGAYLGAPVHGYRPPVPLPPLSPGGAPLADFGSRLLAALIDGAILGGVAVVIALPVLTIVVVPRLATVMDSIDPVTGRPDPAVFLSGLVVPFLLVELGLVLFLLVVYYFYYVEMLLRSGDTVGKRAMGIRVVPIDPGAALTRGMVAKRYLIEFVVGAVVPLFRWLDGLWQLWDEPYQQTLHDKAARTVVIKVLP